MFDGFYGFQNFRGHILKQRTWCWSYEPVTYDKIPHSMSETWMNPRRGCFYHVQFHKRRGSWLWEIAAAGETWPSIAGVGSIFWDALEQARKEQFDVSG